MRDSKKSNHTEWECKYRAVFIPKYRKQVIYGRTRDDLGQVFKRLVLQKESEIEEGYLAPDYVHMLIAIPPKYAVSQAVRCIKGKSGIHIARTYGWSGLGMSKAKASARGYFVSTVGRDEQRVRKYIVAHEAEDRRAEQLKLG